MKPLPPAANIENFSGSPAERGVRVGGVWGWEGLCESQTPEVGQLAKNHHNLTSHFGDIIALFFG